MIKKVIKGYTVFNGMYRKRDEKMYSLRLKKEITGNILHKDFLKENFEHLTSNLWEVQMDVKDYQTPRNNENVKELINQMREAVILLTNEKNDYGQFLREHTQQFLNWWDGYKPQVNLTIKEDVKEDYFTSLKDHFNPQEQFRNFIYGKKFTTIDFTGTRAQLAGIFKQINKNADLIKPSWKDTAKYISYNFTAKGKTVKQTTIEDYFTGRKTLSRKNEIEINI